MLVRGAVATLSQDKTDYEEAGIKLVDSELGGIGIEEAGRLLITQYQDIFRATNEELYKSLPGRLNKLLVLDQWYHKDFTATAPKVMDQEDLLQAYELNKQLGGAVSTMTLENFTELIRQNEYRQQQFADIEWTNSRPSSYETWQQIAKVLATGNPHHYQPTLPPNTHWSNWPESGEL